MRRWLAESEIAEVRLQIADWNHSLESCHPERSEGPRVRILMMSSKGILTIFLGNRQNILQCQRRRGLLRDPSLRSG